MLTTSALYEFSRRQVPMDADGNPITAPPSEDVDQDFEVIANVYRNDGSRLPGSSRKNWLNLMVHFYGESAVKVLEAYHNGRRMINLTGTIKRQPKPIRTANGQTVFLDRYHIYQPTFNLA